MASSSHRKLPEAPHPLPGVVEAFPGHPFGLGILKLSHLARMEMELLFFKGVKRISKLSFSLVIVASCKCLSWEGVEEKSVYFGDEVLRWAHWGSRNATLARRQKKGP